MIHAINKERIVALLALLIAANGVAGHLQGLGASVPLPAATSPEEAESVQAADLGGVRVARAGSLRYDRDARDAFRAGDIWSDLQPRAIDLPPRLAPPRALPGGTVSEWLRIPEPVRVTSLPSPVEEPNVVDPFAPPAPPGAGDPGTGAPAPPPQGGGGRRR